MTTLITGAGGFVGSHLAEALAGRGEDVLCMLYSKDKKHLLDLEKMKQLSNGKFKVVTGDITNKKFVENVVKKCDRVYHQAAILNYKNPTMEEFMKINAEGTLNIMEASLNHGIEKVVYTSSRVTINETGSGRVDENHIYGAFIDNAYVFSKYIAEKIAFEYGARGLNVSVVNPTLIYGPREMHTTGPLIKSHLERGIRFAGFLNSRFNLVYVTDVVNANIAAMNKGRNGHRYILGGIEVSIENFLKLLDQIAGVKKPMIRVPSFVAENAITYIAPILNEIGMKIPVSKEQIYAMKSDTLVDTTKMQKELGIKITSLKTGLEQTIAWYRQTGYLKI